MRYSLRTLLIGTGLCAVALYAITAAYQNWIIPRTPIIWRDCRPAELDHLSDDQNHIIIVAGGWSARGAFGALRGNLETPDLRRLVARQSIQCWDCDATSHSAQLEFTAFQRRTKVGLNREAPMIILKHGKLWIPCPLGFDETKTQIEVTFRTNTAP